MNLLESLKRHTTVLADITRTKGGKQVGRLKAQRVIFSTGPIN